MPSYTHVVGLKLKPTATPEQKASIIDGLRALPAQIPAIQTYRAGADLGLDPSVRYKHPPATTSWGLF